MAFNWQSFKTRTLTAAIFVVVMLAGLLINRWTFFILFSVIHFGCWWEYLRLTEKIYQTTFHKYFKLGLILIGYGLMAWIGLLSYYTVFAFKELLFSIILVIGFILLIMGFSKAQSNNLRSPRFATLGLFYISLSLGLMINLWGFAVSISWMNGGGVVGGPSIFVFIIIPVTIIFSLWVNDTMAYIVGSLIGKTPLSKISPKKTWEGTVGGIILSVLIIGIIFSNIHLENSIPNFRFSFENKVWHWYMLPAIASIGGTFGDLFESKLKRMAGVKDSGHIMPGHGGFLDRFDSLLVAIPFVWLYVYFFMK